MARPTLVLSKVGIPMLATQGATTHTAWLALTLCYIVMPIAGLNPRLILYHTVSQPLHESASKQ